MKCWRFLSDAVACIFITKNCFIILESLCVVEFLTCVPIKCVDSQLSNVGGSEGSWCDINWINS